MNKMNKVIESLNEKNIDEVKKELDGMVEEIWIMEDGNGELGYNVELDEIFEDIKDIKKLKSALFNYVEEFDYVEL